MSEPKCPIASMVCPRNNDPKSGKYCPVWMEMIETNVQTGEERVTKDCGFKLQQRLMIEVIKASNRPAAAIESTRNEIAEGFNKVGSIMMNLQSKTKQLRDGNHG